MHSLQSLTFFIMPDFLLLKVVYRRSLFCMYCISILTRPRVFFPGAGLGLLSAASLRSCGECTESLSLTLERSFSSMCWLVEVVAGGKIVVVGLYWGRGKGFGAVLSPVVWLNLSPIIVCDVFVLEGAEATSPAVRPADRKRFDEGGLEGLDVGATLALVAAGDCDTLARRMPYIRTLKPQLLRFSLYGRGCLFQLGDELEEN